MRARTPGISGHAIMLAIPSNARGLHPWWVWGECLTPPDEGVYPDWGDFPTLGALLGQVRTRWGRPNLVAYYAPLASGQGWYVGDRFCGDQDYPVVETPSDTEAEALLAALEAAP